MHIPLVIAVVSFLAFALIPVLDHAAGTKDDAGGVRSYLARIARWTKE